MEEKELGKRIKVLLKKADMSQTTLAEKCGTYHAQINGYLLGKTKMNYLMLVKIATALDVSIDYIVQHESKNSFGIEEDRQDEQTYSEETKRLSSEMSELKSTVLTLQGIVMKNLVINEA